MIRIHVPFNLRLVSRDCRRDLLRHYTTTSATARTTSTTARVLTSLPLTIPPPTASDGLYRQPSLVQWHAFTIHRASFSSLAPAQSFTFYTSASFSPKGKKYEPENEFYSHVSGTPDFVPNPGERRSRAGQDAYFITGMAGAGEDGNEAVAVGVADGESLLAQLGVGGYDKIGIDSAFFSQGLCIGIASVARAAASADVNPENLLASGYVQTLQDKNIKGGAATACLGVYRRDGVLSTANLGDSRYAILRQGKVHYASQPQTHCFNCPLQLTYVSHYRKENAGGDTPEMCNTSSHQLQEGDVVLFATDGVWDNVSAQEILRGVSSVMLDTRSWKIRKGRGDGDGGITASSKHLAAATQQYTLSGHPPLHTALARTVMRMAKSASTNTKRDGPFAKDVQREFPSENYRGGKVDDITVIVTVVVKHPPTRQKTAVSC